MAATINKRWTVVGPQVKKEYIHVTSDGTAADTAVTTLLANPSTAGIKVVNSDLSGTADGASVTKSGKQLTLRNCTNLREYEIEVTGY